MKFEKYSKGFSLVELMVVVAIIGILASIAIPRFKTFQAKARQSEAKNNLAHVYTLEEAYHGDHDKYSLMDPIGREHCTGSSNDLGFEVKPCAKARYTYSVDIADTVEFEGLAESGDRAQNQIMPGCQTDKWSVNQDKKIWAVTNSIIHCDGGGGDEGGGDAE